jgi:hypothetical protein
MCKHECSGATNAHRECLRRYERLRKMKKPPTVSGDVPTYSRRLYFNLHPKGNYFLTTPKDNYSP